MIPGGGGGGGGGGGRLYPVSMLELNCSQDI